MPCKLMFLIPTLQGGGSERVIVTLARHLDRSKFQVTLVVLDMTGAVYADDVPDDVELINLDCARVRYALSKVFNLVWERRPDVVLSTLSHLNLAVALLRPILPRSTRFLARESTVVTEILRNSRGERLRKMAYRGLYNRFDRIICQSHYMRDDLVENFKVEPQRAIVINNPVDVARIRQMAGDRRVGPRRMPPDGCSRPLRLVAAGRLSVEKGFDLLIRAVLLRCDPNIRLTVVGDGPLRSELEELASVLGVSEQVEFVGFQRNPYPFFVSAHGFVLSSRFEGFPNVVLEALACGVPIISTPAPGGVVEILRGVTGCVLAAAVTAQALADAIAAFDAEAVIPPEVVARYEVATIVHRYEQQLL